MSREFEWDEAKTEREPPEARQGMARNKRIIRASAEDLRRKRAAGESKTDWARVHATSQQEVERLADAEEGILPEGWESTVELGIPERKHGVHIRLDAKVLRWFKAQGPGYQTRISDVLRAFVAARERGRARS
jgi:uncharacterized protein (DUF4415 family)